MIVLSLLICAVCLAQKTRAQTTSQRVLKPIPSTRAGETKRVQPVTNPVVTKRILVPLNKQQTRPTVEATDGAGVLPIGNSFVPMNYGPNLGNQYQNWNYNNSGYRYNQPYYGYGNYGGYGYGYPRYGYGRRRWWVPRVYITIHIGNGYWW